MHLIKITDNFDIKERRIEQYPGEKKSNHTYYKSKKLIEDTEFKQAVNQLGGKVYNVCVCKLGDITLFNGCTWVGINAPSYEECDEWLKKLEKELSTTSWINKENLQINN